MFKPVKLLVRHKLSPLIFIMLFAVAGFVYLRTSHASTPVASVQVEAGNRTANAALVSDTTASGGSAVKFSAAASGGAGGVCNNPFASTSVARGDINIGTDGLFQVRNEAWGGSHGPQTIYACSEQSWYVTSNQPDAGGAVQTYPDSLYSISGTKTVAQWTSITSTFAEEYQHQGDWNAAYDVWLNDWDIEVMIWNEWNGGPGYWATQAKTAVTLGGVPYHFYNNGGELMFFRDTQVKSGSADILAAWQWLVTKNLVKTTDVPTQIEYGVEICSTVGTQRFDTTGFTVSLH
jgi:hypothetical protein